MDIEFTKRNEEGLHCRFCQTRYWEAITDLYESSPVKGIVCGECKIHLEKYIYPDTNTKNSNNQNKGDKFD